MDINVNKVIKVCMFGAALYYCMDFCYDIGKGRMLGTIAKEYPEVYEVMQKLSHRRFDNLRDRLKSAIVMTSAELKMEEP